MSEKSNRPEKEVTFLCSKPTVGKLWGFAIISALYGLDLRWSHPG